ncbi:hypothetical protein [Azonexus sp.]|uniref:hypothetical protein n=1 Tax=Azonexus sp. TaxID=1872668 RepID=UPI0035B3E4A3
MKKTLLSLSLVCLTLPALAQVPSLRAGDPMPRLQLKDQHDKPASIPADLQQVVFAADKAGSALVTDWLDQQPADWLARTKRVYLADIHKMPGLVTRMFALPKLRDKPYAIVLGREAGDLAMFPARENCVTLLPVTAGKVGEVSHACDANSLQGALK